MARTVLVASRIRNTDNIYVGSLFFVYGETDYALALEYGTGSKHWPFSEETFQLLLDLSTKETAEPYIVDGVLTIDFTQNRDIQIIYKSGLRVPITKDKWNEALKRITEEKQTQKTRFVSKPGFCCPPRPECRARKQSSQI